MELGVIFPQYEIGTDPQMIREYVQTAESAGYTHIHAFDHILGVDSASYPDFSGPYDHTHQFHEPFTLFSYVAAFTGSIRLVPGILVLPQRETALVAKQAAEVDLLSNGRFTLGVGVGWNAHEFDALDQEFGNRGRRIEEQIHVLRELWTNDLVEYDGEWHQLADVGINPLPVQQPIPIWMGGGADAVFSRAARLADGWIVPSTWNTPDADLSTLAEPMDTLRSHLAEADRPADALTIVGRTTIRPDQPAQWVEQARQWKELGISHLTVGTMGTGFSSPEAHIRAIVKWKTAIEEAGISER